MGSGIYVHFRGAQRELEELSDEEFKLFVANQKRYQDLGSIDEKWKWIKKLLDHINSQPRRFVITIDQLETLKEGNSINLSTGQRLLVEWADELEEERQRQKEELDKE